MPSLPHEGNGRAETQEVRCRKSDSKASTQAAALQPPLISTRRAWGHGEQTDAPGQSMPFGKAPDGGCGRKASQAVVMGCDQSHPGSWASSGVGESEAGSRGQATDMCG